MQQQPQRKPVPVLLEIPEELLAWASTPEVEVTLARPMAQEVRALIAKGDLPKADTGRLFARLDGLVTAALAAKRGDLLLGFDTFTAAWLGLRYGVDTALGRLEVGRNAAWTFGELSRAYAAGPDGAIAAWNAKVLCAEVFPGVRVDEVAPVADDPCASCGEGGFFVMMLTESGGQYCRRCWATMTTRPRTEAELKAHDRARTGKR